MLDKIKNTPRLMVNIATDFIQARWSEAEPYIMKDPGSAYLYAKDVVKYRWLEAEPYIMKDPGSAYLYAKDVVKDRWLEAEPYILEDEYEDEDFLEAYLETFNLKKEDLMTKQ
jgi:hypothetical protein